jgi:hypothetical protein
MLFSIEHVEGDHGTANGRESRPRLVFFVCWGCVCSSSVLSSLDSEAAHYAAESSRFEFFGSSTRQSLVIRADEME